MDRANPGGFMDPDGVLPSLSLASSAYLRLSEGCSHPLSFCVIPRLRGPVQSRSEETILREARELAAQGVEEFSVIAQDTGDWGRDVISRSGGQYVIASEVAAATERGDLSIHDRLLRSARNDDGGLAMTHN